MALARFPIFTADATYQEEGVAPRPAHGKGHAAMPDDTTASTEPTGNGNGGNLWTRLYEIGARLGLVERAIERHDHYGPRLDTVERDIAAIRGDVADINAHLSQQDRDAAERQRVQEERTGDMLQQLSAMQQLTTETTRQSKLYQAQIGSLDAHRKQHAAEQDGKMDALAGDIADLKRINAARAKIEDDAKELAARRHAETMAATKDMRSSFNVMQAVFPGVIIWLIEGGPNASTTGFLEAVGVAALMIGWNFVPAFVRWLRVKFGR